jgi:hypothetical protein
MLSASRLTNSGMSKPAARVTIESAIITASKGQLETKHKAFFIPFV